MPTFVQPFHVDFANSDPNGPIRRFLKIRLPGWIRTRSGAFVRPPSFALDTGAGYTQMSATLARSLGIEMPAHTSRLATLTVAGRRDTHVRDGEIRVRFDARPGHLFRLYCVFSEDMPPSVPPLLGLNDFADVFRFTVDGAPSTVPRSARSTSTAAESAVPLS